MSKYIDAEFEIDHYTSMTTHPTPDVSEKDKRDSLIILEALQRAKYIDIVHCGECKLHWPSLNDGCVYCTQLMWTMNTDDFCSYGERSGE